MSKSFKEVVRKGVAPKLTFGTNPLDPWSVKSNIAEGRKSILSQYILSLGVDPSALSNDTLISYAKSNEFAKWNQDRKLGMSESVNDFRDTITVNIPLLIRLLELAREDVKTDVELHNIVERMINLRRTVPLTMKHYRQIAGKATRRVVREEKEVEDDNEVKVFDYQTKYFHICPMATDLYTNIENKVNIDSYDLIEGMAKLQDVIFFIEKHLTEKKGSPKEDDLGYLLIAQNVKDQLDRMVKMVNPDMRLQHGYLQGHVEKIKELLDYDNRKDEMNESVEIDETASAGLKAKSSKSGVSIGTLRKVYNRGMAAWKSGHRPGTTPQQWGMARVNSYIGKGKGTYHGADKDLREETDVVKTLEKSLSKPTGYDAIDQMMTTIAKESGITPKELHDKFVKKHDKTPDAYAKSVKESMTNFYEGDTSKLARVPKDKATGLPKKYVAGLSTSTAKARAAHFSRTKKKSDSDPSAYEPAPGDATAKTKPSKHTQKYHAMFGEDMDEELYEACWDGYKQVGLKKKSKKMVPNCVPESTETLTKHVSGTDRKRDALAARTKAHKEIKTPPGSMSETARIVKELYKKKVMEDMYDWEKEDKSIQTYGKKPKYEKTDDEENNGENKPTARAIMTGGTTMTGKTRDIVEIDPMMRNRPGQPDVTKKKDDKKKETKTDK
jgi:hypothetical protein